MTVPSISRQLLKLLQPRNQEERQVTIAGAHHCRLLLTVSATKLTDAAVGNQEAKPAWQMVCEFAPQAACGA